MMRGRIIENIAAQTLRANGNKLYFHEFIANDGDKEKKYEVAFLIVKKKKICPIEVKPSSYKHHKSFDMLAEKTGSAGGKTHTIYKNPDRDGEVVCLS